MHKVKIHLDFPSRYPRYPSLLGLCNPHDSTMNTLLPPDRQLVTSLTLSLVPASPPPSFERGHAVVSGHSLDLLQMSTQWCRIATSPKPLWSCPTKASFAPFLWQPKCVPPPNRVPFSSTLSKVLFRCSFDVCCLESTS